MKVKYLFLMVSLTFLLGAACQKSPVDQTGTENQNNTVTEVACQTPVECFSQCQKSADAEACYFDILVKQDVEFCGQVNNTNLCNDFFKWQEAKTVNDCTLLTTEIWKSRCTENFIDTQTVFDNADFDGDGLTNKEEMILGTSFRKADTDGDGYTDGEEVKAGFDPLTPAQK
jgi:hypothetical protein